MLVVFLSSDGGGGGVPGADPAVVGEGVGSGTSRPALGTVALRRVPTGMC